MSLANQIIIPIISSKQNLEDQNIFIPTYFTLTPSKHDELPDFAFWRKSSSAFKKFKEKKDRKERRHQTESENAEPHPAQNQRKCLKLLKKQKNINYPLLSTDNKMEMPFGYYDPNEAPLYETHLPNEYQCRPKMQDPYLKCEKIDEEVHPSKQERAQSQPIDEEIQVKFIVEPRPDDPFIIIRKENIKKSSKGLKTKHIKKEKNSKSKDGEQYDKNKVGFSKAKQLNDTRIKEQDLAMPGLVRAKTSQSRMADQNQSDSQDSPEPMAHLPISKKEIFTIQQLMDLARPKNGSETGKYPREEGSQAPSECKEEQRCKFIQ